MKRILLIILISFLGKDLIGQPITKRGGASVTVNDENLFVGKSFRVPVFTDTTAANAAVTLDSSGKLIFTYDINGLWLRESNPKKWVEVGSGGGGSGGGIVSLGIVGNYGLTRINDSTYRVDTILIATRARLMHVADSLLAIIGASSNLGNSDLTQTDDERFYNGDGKILYFSNLKSFNISTDSFPQFYFNTESGSEIARFHFDNSGNTGIGYQVFQDIKVDSAEANNANGRSALRAFIAGQGNTANGSSAMSNFLRGSNNLAGGIGSMDVLENGSRNVGLGPYIFGSINSLEFNNNTGVGYRAGFNETRSNMTYYGTIPNLPADTDPTALQDTTETPIYINGNSLEGYWNQSLNIRDSAKIGMHRISADSDSAYTKDPITGKVSYAKINSGGSGTDSSIRKGYGIIIDISGTNRTISGDSLQFATRARLMHVADSLLTIIGAKPSGSGTTDYLARWINSTTLGIGATRDDGSSVGIGTAPSGVAGSISIASRLYIPYYAGSTGGIYVNGLKWGKADVNGNNVIGFNSGSDSATATGNAIFGNGTGGRVNGFGNVLLGDEVAPTMAGYDGSLAGSRNIFAGYQAGKFAIKPSHVISIGTGSGQNADSALSCIWMGKGTGAGTRNSVGDVFLGSSINYTGTYNSSGFNTVVGADAFQAPTTARYNSILGGYAGQGLTEGHQNLLGGYNAAASLTSGYANVHLGPYSGYLRQTSAYNVFIGNLADAYSAVNDNYKLFINSDGVGGSRALIGGSFQSRQVGINYTLPEIAALAQTFAVNGHAYVTQNIKLGGVTNGNGHKVLRFNTTDSLPYLADTLTFSAGFGLNLAGSYPNIHYAVDSSEVATLTALRDSAAAIRAAGGGGGGVTSIGVTTANGVSGISSGGTTPNLTITLGAITPTSVAATSFVRAPYLYGGDLVATYPGYSGGVLGGIATGGVLDFYHNNSRIGEFYTTSGAFNFFTDVAKDLNFYVNSSLSVPALNILSTGNVGIGLTTPTAGLHLKAGTTTLAPGKLTAGIALTTPEDGAIEYHGSHIYFTIGSTRYQLDQQAGTNLGNSNLTQTGGNRSYSGGNQNLSFNGGGTGTEFNVEYGKIILTGLNSGILIQGDSIIIDSETHLIHIDSLLQSVIPTNKMVVWDSIGKKLYSQAAPLSSTYTPTLTNVANVAASTAYSCQYSRVGTVVTVSGEVDIDPTTTLTLTQLGISLPIASNLTATNELGGTSADDLNTAARVAGDATNNRAEIRMTPVDVTNRRFSFTFTYRVL